MHQGGNGCSDGECGGDNHMGGNEVVVLLLSPMQDENVIDRFGNGQNDKVGAVVVTDGDDNTASSVGDDRQVSGGTPGGTNGACEVSGGTGQGIVLAGAQVCIPRPSRNTFAQSNAFFELMHFIFMHAMMVNQMEQRCKQERE
jgi:hypothetical protein